MGYKDKDSVILTTASPNDQIQYFYIVISITLC